MAPPSRNRRDVPRRPPAFRARLGDFGLGAQNPVLACSLGSQQLLVGGLFRSLQFTSINALAFADVPALRMSQATSMTSVLQQISVSVGISIAAISLEVATGGNIAAITSHQFILPFVIVGGLAALSVLSFISLPWDAGQEMSGHHRELAPDPVTAARER